ncbi:hypothetical protein Tco_0516570 [Tanacetum coccineum]
MLDRTNYESWSQRIRLYCRGKENGLLILQSIDQGPFELGTTRNTLGTTLEGGVLLGPERPRTYEDLSDTEKKQYDADVRTTNIVLQGLPKDIYVTPPKSGRSGMVTMGCYFIVQTHQSQKTTSKETFYKMSHSI